MLVATAQQIVTHTLGGTPAIGYGVMGIVNRAGRLLVNMRGWRWLERASTTLSLTAGQSYVALPADFGELRDIQGAIGLVFRPVAVDGIDLNMLRSYPEISPSSAIYYYDSTYRVIGGLLVPVLDLFNTPTEDTPNALRIVYKRGWAELTGDETTPILMPPFMDPLFEEVIRCTARGTEEEDVATLYERLDPLKDSLVYESACSQDGRNRVPVGTWKHGAIGSMMVERMNDADQFTFNNGNPT